MAVKTPRPQALRPDGHAMATISIGDYAFKPADRVENYGGDINIYCCWEHHLLIPCPAAYRLSPDLPLIDFLEKLFRPDHQHHPDYARLNYLLLIWTLDGKSWQPKLAASLREGGVVHMSYLSFRAPGLDGLNGHGV